MEGMRPFKNFKYYLNNAEMTFIILSFAQLSEFIMGRSSEADIRLIIDKSVSRKNSRIFMKDNRIYM
jgi:hypothetical protein